MNKEKLSILIVEDEDAVRMLLGAYLGAKYRCVTASSAEEAIQLLGSAGPFNLVLTDIKMPGASGLELCQYFHKQAPETVVIMVSGQDDIAYAIKAMREGAFDYVTKPFEPSQLSMSVERALRHQVLVQAERHHAELLERTVQERTTELRTLNDGLNQTLEVVYTNYRATLQAMAAALEARDCEARGHSDRVVAYCLRLGKQLGLTDNQLITLEQGALLHDIGKIGMRDSLLLKTGPLTQGEQVEMREHIGQGLHILDRIDLLSGARPVVGQHHEKFDGSGYPAGLSGESIHLNARIFAVADAFDAITSDRPYRASRSYAEAREEIVRNSGSHFDPKVADAFLNIAKTEWAEIRRAAESHNYVEQLIDKRELRTFVVSLKWPHIPGPCELQLGPPTAASV